MTRIVVGPFNRVEGDLELTLDIDDGVVREARVAASLYRGFEQLLLGRPAEDALVIAPRVCGICSVSQSLAAAAVLRGAQNAAPARNGLIATNLAHAAENIADHLTHFYVFFMPDFARAAYAARSWHETAQTRFRAVSGAALREALPARARLLETMGLIAGKWPHSLAFRPGGVTRALALGDEMRLVALLADFRGFIERTLFAAPIEAVIELASGDALDRFAHGAGAAGDFAAFVRIARDLRLEQIGRGPGLLMSAGAYLGSDGHHFPAGLLDAATGALRAPPLHAIEEDVSHSFMRDTAGDPARAETVPDIHRPGAYSFAKAPRLEGRAVEVGALARQAVAGHPLIRDLLAPQGASNVFARIVARLLEIALLTQAMDGWTRDLRRSEPFCTPDTPLRDGAFAGFVEAARGALGHWASYANGEIARYQIIAPTTWNFSPRDASGRPGPLEFALQGLDVGAEGASSVALQHIVRSFDPCMVCTAH
ncbi:MULTISPECIES: nickel-dependent hydrogenase large subunit [Methylosinus]|uniref:HupV protein n=1 Tax=Methylosinus trichosporium (strain ATCC 35070 / NCIMB 11131 / UNIQEM 75 / OB3b) TaxID=595536 RepID=A0A2D2CWK1_METT3|nr:MULTISPECIES: nickel-dependent hydrogenase large subunit [Methylosinus]ATQ67054.1 HupV protein [Methylosinus trichosporium OB3b]OBS50854.1 HupV protein [Methylosinus sp. 3S-1]